MNNIYRKVIDTVHDKGYRIIDVESYQVVLIDEKADKFYMINVRFLSDLTELNSLLVKFGVSIVEINVIIGSVAVSIDNFNE